MSKRPYRCGTVSAEAYRQAVEQEALPLGIPLSAALSGSRIRSECVPRFHAFRRLHDEGVSLTSLARVSGYATSSVARGIERSRWHHDRRLGWCPPPFREAYRALTAKGWRAAEARQAIEDLMSRGAT